MPANDGCGQVGRLHKVAHAANAVVADVYMFADQSVEQMNFFFQINNEFSSLRLKIAVDNVLGVQKAQTEKSLASVHQ